MVDRGEEKCEKCVMEELKKNVEQVNSRITIKFLFSTQTEEHWVFGLEMWDKQRDIYSGSVP